MTSPKNPSEQPAPAEAPSLRALKEAAQSLRTIERMAGTGECMADPLSPQDRKLVDGVLDDLAGLISGTSGTGGPSGLA